MITLIGMGSGTPESLTAQGLAALQNAGLILGAKRLLEQLPQGCTDHRKALYQPEDVLAALAADPEVDAALVYSGDTGFYSGAAQLLPMLRAFGISCRVLPGLSSVQLLAAAVGRSWQEWKLVSAHGCACDPVAECLTAGGKPVFFLTGGAETPASLCGRLAAAGLGDAHVLVGEELGRAEEKILFGTAQEFAQKQFASLSVLLVEHLPQPPRRVPGFPDGKVGDGAFAVVVLGNDNTGINAGTQNAAGGVGHLPGTLAGGNQHNAPGTEIASFQRFADGLVRLGGGDGGLNDGVSVLAEFRHRDHTLFCFVCWFFNFCYNM